jgi:hypothetical protein
MRKQITCFDENMSSEISYALLGRAANHHFLILQPTMSKLDMPTALRTFLPQEERDMAVKTHTLFHEVLRSDAYRIQLHVDGVNGVWYVHFWWGNDAAYADVSCFAVRPGVGMHDFQPGAFTTELLTTLEEYVDNSERWGLVLDVFKWLNEDIVKPRDYAHMFFLMPALQGVIAGINREFAAKIGGVRSVVRPPVSAEALPFVQQANLTLAGSYLLPENDGNGMGPVHAKVTPIGDVSPAGWGRTFKRCL